MMKIYLKKISSEKIGATMVQNPTKMRIILIKTQKCV